MRFGRGRGSERERERDLAGSYPICSILREKKTPRMDRQTDGRTNGRADGQTKPLIESLSQRLIKLRIDNASVTGVGAMTKMQ